MRIETQNKDNGIIMRLSGKVIGDSVPKLKQTLEEQIDSDVCWLILDLADVPLMDSSALGTIIAVFLRLQERNGKVVFINAQKSIVDVLSITKLNKLFEVYDNIQGALQSVEPGAVES